jgi:hypothetical protein
MTSSMKRFLILFAVSFVVFFPALHGTYLYWDDTTHIINNPNLVDGHWWEFWTQEYYRLYIPVIYTVWTWVFMISSAGTAFHIFNYLLHAVNGALFFRLAQLAVPAAAPAALWLATLAYMVHPLQTEPVAWIAGGRDLLSAFFAFATAVVIWRPLTWKTAGGSTILFVLSLLSKATTAPLPVALLFIPEFRKTLTRAKMWLLGLWLACAVVVLYINKMVQQVETDNLIKPLSVTDRALTVIDIFGFYVQKIFVPWPMSGDYGRIPWLVIDKQMYMLPLIIMAVTVAILAVIKYLRPRFPIWWVLFFGVILSPVSGVVTFMAQSQSSVADRYLYLAWAGPCLAIALALTRWPRLKPVAAALVVAWAGVSFTRAHVWTDNTKFFPDMLSYNPDSFVGHTTMGVVDFGNNRMDLAEAHFKAATKLMPLSVSPIGNLAQTYHEQGRMVDIINDVVPVFEQPGFIEFNKTNKESVARCARVIARAYLSLNRYPEAHQKLCLALVLAPEDREVQSDFVRFAQEMQKRGLPVQPCPPLGM